MAARKRNRQSVVCVFCKKRKVKCDKGQPCSTCIKYGNDDCTYDNIGINDDLKRDRDQEMTRNEIRLLENKIRKLRNQLEEDNEASSPKDGPVIDKNYPFHELIGVNPVAAHDDKLNFYDRVLPVTSQSMGYKRNNSPFHWITLMKGDIVLSGLLEYLMHITAFQRDGKKVLNSNLKTVETEFEKKLESVDGSVDSKLYKDNNWQNSFATVSQSSNSSQATEVIPSQDINGNANLIGRDIPSFRMSSTSDNDTNGLVLGYNKARNDNTYVQALGEKIRISLPPKEIIWRLLKVFFEEFYFLFPLFDQLEFYQSIIKIIGVVTYKYEPVLEMNIEKRMDFAHIGTLLLILRITYLLLSSRTKLNLKDKKSSLKDPTIKMLLGRPISVQFYDFARQCLGMFDILSTASLPVFQFALLLRLYNVYAPEEGDGDRESEVMIFNNVLLNMAISLGLNREPDHIPGYVGTPQAKHLHRKLWWTVYSMNIHQSFVNGSKFNIRSTDFDTKPLFYEAGFANTNYGEMERVYCEVAGLKLVVFESVLELTDLVSSVKGDADMRMVSKSLEFMETSILKGYGRILDTMDDSHTFSSELRRLAQVRLHLLTATASITILYNFFIYYEKRNNLKLREYYVRKMIVLIGLDLIPLCYEIVHNTSRMFKTIPVVTIVPDMFEAIQKSILVFISFFIRCRTDVMLHNKNEDHDERVVNDPEYIDYFTLLNKTTQLFSIVAKDLIEILVEFSPTYFYAWKLTKSMKAFYEISSNRVLYDCPHLRTLTVLSFTESSIKEIHEILSQTVKKIDEVNSEVQRKTETDDDLSSSASSFTESRAPENVQSFTSDGSHVTPGTPFNWNFDVPNADVPIDAAGVDKIWTEVLASKVDTDGYQNIANYANAGFDNAASFIDFEAIPDLMDGRAMDEMLKSFLEKN
ncbi:hypothetical protein CLIB1444_08S00870 [[Candida] jaroonii]|uniref:Uncharacterized protein n=1 Tax=[Candida] jaroonii TaxID=467808 RepID=A0ACA9YAG2_9ASCO|nr:hypothetical protein CLIB1444_08S00870 [[Candida] jaroonii]